MTRGGLAWAVLTAVLAGCEAPLPEATIDAGGVTFDFRRLSDEAFAKGPDARTPGSNEFAVCLSPHDCLGNDFAVPAGQCGTVGFDLRNGKGAKWYRKDLSFRLTVPKGFALLGTTFGDGTKAGRTALPDGAVVHDLPILEGFSVNWTQYHRMTALVRATGPVGTEGMAKLEAFRAGKPYARSAAFRLFTVPPISSVKPKRYMNGIYPSGVSVTFNGNADAAEAFADLLDAAGVQWLIPDDPDERNVALWRKAGVKVLTPPIRICNAYMVPDEKVWKPMPDSDRFKAVPANGAFQKGFDRLLSTMSICPFAVIDESPYFLTNVVPNCIDAKLKGMDGSWANWEPHMYEDRGCDCARCRAEFGKWKTKHGDDIHLFRSWVHGRYVRTLDRFVRKASGGAKSFGFIPGVCWRACTTAWERKLFSKEFRPADYLADLEWFNPWGPYVYWDAEKPLGKNEREPLWHWFFAKDMREAADRACGNGRRTKLQAFPSGQQGRSWVTQPEHLGMAHDAFFFNRWEATVAYFFPQGYDARYWRAFAEATSRAALCEDWVWDGTRCDAKVSVETVPEYMPRCDLVSDYVPSSTNASRLQVAAYDLKGSRLVAALNFCDFAEAYFTLSCEGLTGRFTVTDEQGVRYLKPDGGRAWTGEDLRKGLFLKVGAARTCVYFIAPVGSSAAPAARSAISTAALEAEYRSVRGRLAKKVGDGVAAMNGGKPVRKDAHLID